MRLSAFSKKHPFWCSILVVVGEMLLLGVVSMGAKAFVYNGTYESYFWQAAVSGVAQILLGVGSVMLMRRMQLAQGAFCTKGTLKGVAFGWYSVLFAVGLLCVNLMFADMQLVFHFWPFVIMLGVAFSTSFFEEVLVRGFALHVLLGTDTSPKNIQKACFVSSAIFGAAHFLNLATGADLASTIGQVIYATFIGALLAAVYVRSKTLWAPIVLHAIIDFSSFALNAIVPKEQMEAMLNMPVETVSFSEAIVSILPTIIIALPCLLCALVLLRKKKLQALTSSPAECLYSGA